LSDKGLGAAMLVGSVVALIIYLMALFLPSWGGVGGFAWYIAITVIAIIAVGAVCVIIGWVGYTLLTTPASVSPITIEEKISSSETEEKKEEESKT
jgi:predicted DNA-binding transcriptional regulator